MKLSEQLKEQTKKAHKMVESSLFMQELITGTLSKRKYLLYIRSLFAIYSTLERQLTELQKSAYIQPIYLTKLFRSDALKNDLNYLSFAWNISDIHSISLNSVKRYTDRILFLFENPHLLVAHCYVRYLGDLSGGQILKKIIKTKYLSEIEGGQEYYSIPIEDIEFERNSYRMRLDSIPLNSKETKEVIEEAVSSFEFNLQLFLELEQRN